MKRCIGKTKAGERCSLKPKRGKKWCHHHLPSSEISDNPATELRTDLQGMEETRETFIGHFKRVGSKPGGRRGKPALTVLLTDIRRQHDPAILSDHSWFNLTKGFQELGGMQEGEAIQFTATIKRYEKGFGKNKTYDYRFYFPLSVCRPAGTRSYVPTMSTGNSAGNSTGTSNAETPVNPVINVIKPLLPPPRLSRLPPSLSNHPLLQGLK